MKNTLLIIAALIFISCNNKPLNFDNSEWGGTISPTDERNDMVNKFVDSYSDNNLESVKYLFADDAIIQVNDDTMTTIEKLSGIVKSFNFDTMKKIEFSNQVLTESLNFDSLFEIFSMPITK